MFFLKELPTQKMLERYSEQYSEMDLEKTDAALRLLRRASLFIRKLDQYFAKYDLSQTRFLILIILDREPDLQHLTISDLVERLDVSKPVITNTIKTLCKSDLVNISACQSDMRSKMITITDQGREKLKTVLPNYYKLINEEMDNVNE